MVPLANATFAQGESGRGHLSATCSPKELKDAKDVTAVHSQLQHRFIFSVSAFVQFAF